MRRNERWKQARKVSKKDGRRGEGEGDGWKKIMVGRVDLALALSLSSIRLILRLECIAELQTWRRTMEGETGGRRRKTGLRFFCRPATEHAGHSAGHTNGMLL